MDALRADRVLKNGVIYTMDKAGTMAEALAIKDGRIIFVGMNKDAAASKGQGTVVVDLEGKTVLPGMIETHLHPPGTADSDLFSISLFDTMNSLKGMLGVIKEFVKNHPDLDLYFGSGFSTGAEDSGHGTFPGKNAQLGIYGGTEYVRQE